MIFVIGGSMMLGIFIWEINKRKEKLKQLNSYLSLVCAGHYELDISDNEEGEISILKNNLRIPYSSLLLRIKISIWAKA